MNVALDTNAYSNFLRGDPIRVEIVQKADRIYLPFIVLGELRAGFAAGSRETENLGILQQFRASPRVSVLWPDETTTETVRCVDLHTDRAIAQSSEDVANYVIARERTG